MKIEGFTFVEIIIALAIACIIITISSSVLFTILRMDASGQSMLKGVLAVQRVTCRHFIPDLQENQNHLTSATALQSLTGEKKSLEWTVYPLTMGTEVDSIGQDLVFKK